MQSQAISLQTLETQVGQLDSLINNHTQGSLSSTIEINPKGEGNQRCKAITLRSGKELSNTIMKPELKERPLECESRVNEKKEQIQEDKKDKKSISGLNPYNPPLVGKCALKSN